AVARFTSSQPSPSRVSRQEPARPFCPPALTTSSGVDLSASGGGSSEDSPPWVSSPEDSPSALSEAAALVGSSARSSPSPPMLPITNRSTTSSTAAAPMMMMYSRFSRQNGSSARWAPWKDTASASSSNRSGGYGYWESATAPLNLLARIGAGSTRPGSAPSGDAMAPVGGRGAGIGGASSPQPVHDGGGGAQRRRLVEQGVQPHVVGDLGQTDLLADRPLLGADVAEGAPLQGEDPQIALAELVLARGAGIRGVGHGGHAPRLRRRGAPPATARRPAGPGGRLVTCRPRCLLRSPTTGLASSPRSRAASTSSGTSCARRGRPGAATCPTGTGCCAPSPARCPRCAC